MEETQKKHWFAPKVYGWGFVPITREGWVVVLLIILVILIGSPFILGTSSDPGFERVILFLLFVMFVALAPILLMKHRMIGTLKRRRGKKDIDW